MLRALLVAASCCLLAAAQHTATRLRVEYIERPLTIDVAIPRFSYALQHDTRGQTQTSAFVCLREHSARIQRVLSPPSEPLQRTTSS